MWSDTCSLSLLLCAKSEEPAEKTGEDIHLDLGSGLASFPFKERPSIEQPVWTLLTDQTRLKSLPHTLAPSLLFLPPNIFHYK